jgi:hypothetical protein
MANTFVAIQTVTVGSGGSATIEFTSIPQTFTDLNVLVSGRTTANADTYGETDLSFNGAPSGTSYSWRQLLGTGGSASSQNGSSDSAIYFRWPTGSGATASVFGTSSIYVPNYTSSNYKSVSIDSVTENNASQAMATMTAGLWSDTAAITSLRLTIVYGTAFAEYSTATLYGIKSS